MAKIYNVRNGGDPSISLGMKQIGGYNVFPITVVATSTGTTIPLNAFQNYEWFNVAQTSAATDYIFLPTNVSPTYPNLPIAGVGYELMVYAVSAMKVKPIVGSGQTINGGTNAQGISIPAGSYADFVQSSTNGWVCQLISATGVVTTPTPS